MPATFPGTSPRALLNETQSRYHKVYSGNSDQSSRISESHRRRWCKLMNLMRLRVKLIAGAVAILAGVSLCAQQGVFRSGTRVVSIFATVIDAQKRLVPDLTKTDFEILDNEKPQEIQVFVNEVQPITVVVMLDTSASMTGNLALLTNASEQFLIRLQPKDK